MNYMEKVMNDVAQYQQNKPLVEMCRLVPQEQIQFSKTALFQTIANINQMDDQAMLAFIERNFDKILFNVFNGSDIVNHIRLFQDTRFLDNLIKVLGQIKWFNKDQIIRLNTIAYNYITAPDNTNGFHKDQAIVDRMITIGNIVNRAELPRLLGLGYSDNLANMLLIARYSDADPGIVIKRIDFIIITQPLELMSQRMITETLRILFDVFKAWPKIFSYYMEDVLVREPWVTDEIEEVDSTMQLSVLEILDNLPTEIIFDTLRNYANAYHLKGKNIKRFSMQRLSDDYYRINQAVWSLANVENIYIP